MENITYDSEGVRLCSKWLGGKDFNAQIIPFGTLVEYLPPESPGKETPEKWASSSTPGIFVGYELGELGSWDHIYLVLSLKDLATVNLSSDVYASNITLGKPNRVYSIRVANADWPFPLRVHSVSALHVMKFSQMP